MKKRMLFGIIFVFVIILNFNISCVFGDVSSEDKDFWGQASGWWEDTAKDNTIPSQASSIINTFSDMINVVGTTLIVIATIVLGIKYIFGSVEDKGAAKEGLITLLIACIFFFGWSAIKGLLMDEHNNLYIISGTGDYKTILARLMGIFTYIAKLVLIIAIIYVGVKYIFAGAQGKAELKGKSVYFFIGIILAFATTNVLSFISNIINSAI